MGNKISLGKYILYCGLPAKRRKTKKKEEEKRQEMVEFELYRAFMKGERFKAAHPEYVRQAGLVPSTYFPTALELGESSDYYGQDRSVKSALGNEGTAWDDGLSFTGLPATDKSYNSDDSVFLGNQDGIDEELATTQLPADDKSFDSNLDDSVFPRDHDGIDEELTLMGLPAADQSYNSDDSVFLRDDSQNVTSIADDVTSDAWTQEDAPEPEADRPVLKVDRIVHEVDPSVPEVDRPVPEVDPSVSEVDPSVPEVDPSVPEVDRPVPEEDPSVPEVDRPVPEEDLSVPKEDPTVSNEDHLVPKRDPAVSKEDPVVPKMDSPVCGKVPTVRVSEEDSIATVSERGHVVEAAKPVSFTVPANTPASEESSAVAIEKETPPVISSANSADDEHSTMSSPQSPTEAFNPRFTSSFMSDSEHPRPRSLPYEIISLSSQSSTSLPTPPPPPPPPSRRMKSTINSDRRRAKSSFSRRSLRSVTFTSTPEEDSSSNQSEVEREGARISSSKEVFTSQQDRDCSKAVIQVGGWIKGGQRLSSKQPLNQRSKKESQTRSHSRTAVKSKPSLPSEIVRRPRQQSFQWNGRCVYNSGYPSLVGDRIESASEDEELWEKKLAIVGPKTPVKRHVLCGQGKILDHNLIPGSQLNKDFNQEDVSVYLKERRQQCNLYHYGIAAISCNVDYQTRKEGISGVIIPPVFKEQSCLESSAVLTALKNLHDELKHFHQDTSRHLRSSLPRMSMNSMERRQTFLEARVETLESRQAVVAFKETGDENVRQQLKALREDLEKLHQTSARKRGKKEAELKEGLSPKVDKDIEIEDIEDGISVDITHHEEQSDVTPCAPEVPVRPSPTPSVLELRLKTDALAEKQTTPAERRLRLVRERNSAIRKWRMGVEETEEMGRNVEKVERGVTVIGRVEKVGGDVEKAGGDVEKAGGDVEKARGDVEEGGGEVDVKDEVEKVGDYMKVEDEVHNLGKDVEKIEDVVERVEDDVRKVEELGRYSKDGWNQRDTGKTLAQTNTIQPVKNAWYPEALTHEDTGSGKQNTTVTSVGDQAIVSGQDNSAARLVTEQPECAFSASKTVESCPEIPAETSVVSDLKSCLKQTSVEGNNLQFGSEISRKLSVVGKNIQSGLWKTDVQSGPEIITGTSVVEEGIHSSQDILAKPSGVGKHVHFGPRIPKQNVAEKDDIHPELQAVKTSVLKDYIYSGLDILAKASGVKKHVHFGPQLPEEAAMKENISPSTGVPAEASLMDEEIHSGSALSGESSVVDEDIEADPESSLKSTEIMKDIQHRATAKDIYFAPDISTEFTAVLNNVHCPPETLTETSVVEEDIELCLEAPAETSVIVEGIYSGSESPAEFTVAGNDIQSRPEITERTSVVEENVQSFQKTLKEIPVVGEHIQSGPKTPFGTSVVENGVQSGQKVLAGTCVLEEYIEMDPDELAETTVVEEDVQSGLESPEEILVVEKLTRSDPKTLAKAAVVGSDIQFGPETSEESSLVKDFTPFDPKSPFGKFVSGAGTMGFGSSGQYPSRDVLFWRGNTAAGGVGHKDTLHDQNRLTGTSMAEDGIQGDLEIPTENSVTEQETATPIVEPGTVVKFHSGVAGAFVEDDYIQSDLEMRDTKSVTDVALQVDSIAVGTTQNTTAESIGLEDLPDNRVKQIKSSAEESCTKTNSQSGGAYSLTAPSLGREDLHGNLEPVLEKTEQQTKFCRKTSVTDDSRKPVVPYFFVKEDIQLGLDSSTENSVESLQSGTETPNAVPAALVEFQSRAEIEAEDSVVDEDIQLGRDSSVDDSVESLQFSTETPNAVPAVLVEFQSKEEIEAEDSVVDEDIQCGLVLPAVNSVTEMDVKTGPIQDVVVESIQDGAVTPITESFVKEAIQSALVVSNKDVNVGEGDQSSPTYPIAERFPKKVIQTSHQKVPATSAVKDMNNLELSRDYGLANKDIQFSPTTSNKIFRYERVFGALANQDTKSNREYSTKYSLAKKDSRRDDESSLESSISDLNSCAEIPEPVTEVTQTCQDSSASTSAANESSGRKSQTKESIGENIPSDKEMLSENSVQIARDIFPDEGEIYSEETSPSLKSEEDDLMYESSIEEIIEEILTDEEEEDEEEEDGNKEEKAEEGREKEQGEKEEEQDEVNKEGEENEDEEKEEGKGKADERKEVDEEDEDEDKDEEGNQEEDRVEGKEKEDEGEEETEEDDYEEEEKEDEEGNQENETVQGKEKVEAGEDEEKKDEIPSGRTVYRFDIATGHYVQTTVVDHPGLEKDIRAQTDTLTDRTGLENEISAGGKTPYVKHAVDDIPCDQETLFGEPVKEEDTKCYSETKTVQSEEGYRTIGRTLTPFSVTKGRPRYGTNSFLETLNEGEILGGNEGPLAELFEEEDTSLENETEEMVSEEGILSGQHTSAVQSIEEESVLFGQRTPPGKSAFKKEIRSLREKWSGGSVAEEDFQFGNLIEKYDSEDFGTRQETSITDSNSKESVDSMDSNRIQSNGKTATASVVVKDDSNSPTYSNSKESVDSVESNEMPSNQKKATASVFAKEDIDYEGRVSNFVNAEEDFDSSEEVPAVDSDAVDIVERLGQDESQTSSKTSTLLREIKEDTRYNRGMFRRTVPDWKDDFELCQEMSSADSDVKKKGEQYLRGTPKISSGPEEVRRPGRETAESVVENDISSAIEFSVPSMKHSDVKGTDLGLKLDEDYELNTLSDISSISEMAPAQDTTNDFRNKEVVLQAELTNDGGSVGVEEMHGSTNVDQANDEPTVKIDQGEGKTTNEENEKEKEKTESESSDSLSEIVRQLYPEEHDKMFMTHDSGEKPRPKKVSPDPNSSVMKKLNEITSKIRPNRRLKEMAANKALKEEQQRQEREASAQLYRNKPLGLRNLEKFRDEVCSKPTAFVEREVSAQEYMQHMLDFESVAPGLHAMESAGIQDHPRSFASGLGASNEFLQQATSRGSLAPPGPRGSFPRRGLSSRNTAALPAIGSKLPSMESSPEKNDGSLRKTSPLAMGRSFRNANEDRPRQNIPKNPYGTSDNSRVQPAFGENTPIESDFYEDVFGNEELEVSKNSGTKIEVHNQGYGDSSSNAIQPGSTFGVSPKYRTPEERKPAALIPLNITRKDARGSGSDLASRAASLAAALGFGSVSDPWKPAALPMIPKSSTGLKHPEDRLASVVPKPKSFFASSITKPMKPAVLPGIGQRPLPGIGSLGKPANFDRAI